MVEDFSYGADFKSALDGFAIGALHWNGEIDSYDEEAGLMAVLNGYDAAVNSTSVRDVPNHLLAEAYPNPFSDMTTIHFYLDNAAHARLIVHDVFGRRIAVLANDQHGAGFHKVTFDGRLVSSGVYLVTLEADNFRKTLKMMVR